MNKKVLKYVGIAGVAAGSIALYFSGAGESAGTAVVGGVFAIIAIIAQLIKE